MGHPTAQSQSSDEQWAEWRPHISSGRWLLCYAQTEAAHGSNLGGLRTTATFCRETDEWEIHTPEPSAGKMWIGGSGSTATHALVMAKLIIGDRHFGMHPFLVPLRDTDTHCLLPGRSAIDMGPKKGANSMDNGYLMFDHVRVPRDNLLMRFQTVDKEGTYSVRNEQGKLLIRGTMTLVRVGLCEIAAHHAARATLIAIRYAVIRRQGSSKDVGGGKSKDGGLATLPLLERQIIDYPGVQQRLFTAIASSYALTLASRHMRGIYNELQSELQSSGGKSPLLGIVHGYTSVLKAVMTTESYNVVWRCRKSMGGLGYSAASGLTDLENSQPDANLTYEGDNNMLLQGPAANFLVKELKATKDNGGKPRRPELSYMAQHPAMGETMRLDGTGHGDDRYFNDAQVQLRMVAHRAARLVHALSDLRALAGQSGAGSHDTVHAQLDARLSARASQAHGAFFILYAFVHTIDSLRQTLTNGQALANVGVALDEKVLAALDRVRSLYALDVCILDTLGDYTEDGYLDMASVDAIRCESARVMNEIRPDALALSEAADIDDWYLASPLGASDGRAYARLMDFMQREPINRPQAEGGVRGNDDGVLLGFRDTIGRLTHGEVEPWNTAEAEKREAERRPERSARL